MKLNYGSMELCLLSSMELNSGSMEHFFGSMELNLDSLELNVGALEPCLLSSMELNGTLVRGQSWG